MGIFFNYNGKFYESGTAIIGPANRGLRYGDGLFETMKLSGTAIHFADDHFARLWKGLALLQFDLPKHFTPERLQEEIQALAAKNGHNPARVRLNVFRGEGGLYDPADHRPNYSIESWQLPANTGEWNANGLVLGIYKDACKTCDRFSGLKHNNYLPYVMAALAAKKEKWNDAILLNTGGNVCDSTIANIFIVKDKAVATPALSEGCVAGVMRWQLINILRAAGIPIAEKPIGIDELLNADEVFLTNSIHGIRWVQSVEDTHYTNVFTAAVRAMAFE